MIGQTPGHYRITAALGADSLTEEVITDLTRIEALRVISRNSAMALKGTTRDTPCRAEPGHRGSRRRLRRASLEVRMGRKSRGG